MALGKSVGLLSISLLIGLSAQVGLAATSDNIDDSDLVIPRPVISKSTWLFHWTNDSSARDNLQGYLNRAENLVQNCSDQIAAAHNSLTNIPGCQGNGLAAGPGLYFTDNPFTAHDYGNILVITKTKANEKNIVDISDLIRSADVVDSKITSNSSLEAILYPFRRSAIGTQALVVRKSAILGETSVVKVPDAPKEFNDHPSYVCSDRSNIQDVMTAWSDQVDFMAIIFDSFNDPSGGNFKSGTEMNQSAWLAALASNIVAVTPGQLKIKATNLSAASPEIKEKLSSDTCSMGFHNSIRSCLAYELYVSLMGDTGTEKYPTGAWSFATLKKALLILQIISLKESVAINNLKEMQIFLSTRFQKANAQKVRAQEAFHCTEVIRTQLIERALSNW